MSYENARQDSVVRVDRGSTLTNVVLLTSQRVAKVKESTVD